MGLGNRIPQTMITPSEIQEGCREHLAEIRQGKPAPLVSRFELLCPACAQLFGREWRYCPKCKKELVGNPRWKP